MTLDASASIFYAAEIEVYQPGPTSLAFDFGHGTRPPGTLSLRPLVLETPGVIRASDRGYRTREADAGGLHVYPPVLRTGFEIDRRVGLAPGDASTRTYGAIHLDNLNQRFDAYAASRNSDNRAARVLLGVKGLDPALRIEIDPPYAEMQPFFVGVALPWQLDEQELTIPLADPAAWIDRPVQSNVYLGTGDLEGGPDLAGKPKPMTRGGTADTPNSEVPLVAVDPVALIYQWTDGRGTIVTLYEGGAAVFIYDGDVADIYGGTPPAAGHYRTCNARGVLQLGSKPVFTLSADATGAYPITAATTVAAMALAMLIEDMDVSPDVIDVGSFEAADAALPFLGGYYIGTSQVQGSAQLALILGSINARLVCTRSGLLSCFLLAPLPLAATPSTELSPLNAVNVTPQALPSTVDPPPFRVQVGYATYWQTQTSAFNGSISASRQQQLATATRYAVAFSASVKRQYRRPNDPAPVATILLVQSHAFVVASTMLGLFASRPGFYQVDVPIAVAADIDLGSVVRLVWPLAGLAGGALGQVVGDQVRSDLGTVTLLVLCGPSGTAPTLGGTAELGVFQLGINELAP